MAVRPSIAVHLLLVALFLLLSAFAAPRSAWAQEVEEPATVYEAPVPRAFGQPGSVQLAPGSGSITDSLRLSVPPARRGFEPKLSLGYSSAAGNGDLGRGWSLGGLGHVEYYTGNGVELAAPSAGNAQRTYGYLLNGQSGELIALDFAAESQLRPAHEQIYVDFRRYWPDTNLPEDRFEAQTGDGVKSFFGRSQASRTARKWFLDGQRDKSGNTIDYLYAMLDRNGDPCPIAGGDCALYPAEILYASHPLLPTASNRIAFEYETRPDVRTSWRGGFREVRGLRLARINMFASDCGDVTGCPVLVRRYEFSYTQSQLTGESLLQSIVLVGADDTSRVTLRTLEYGSRSLEWTIEPGGAVGELPDALNFVNAQEQHRGTSIIDVNGDGYNDALARVDDLSRPSVFLGGPNGFTLDPHWSAAFAAIDVDLAVKSGERYGASTGVNLVDVNGDTRPDVVIADGSGQVWLNTGTSVAVSPNTCDPCGWVLDEQWSFALQTLEVVRTPTNPPGPPEVVQGLVVNDPTLDNGIRFIDFNGDGLVDILQSLSGDVEIKHAFKNTGTGWEDVTDQVRDIPPISWQQGSRVWTFGHRFVELNGDGLIDYIYATDRSPANTPKAWLGSPDGWYFDAELSSSLEAHPQIEVMKDQRGTGLLPVDFNGDGLVDFIRAYWTAAAVPPHPPATLIAWRNNGVGWQQDSEIVASLLRIEDSASTPDDIVPFVTFNMDLSALGLPPDVTRGLQLHDVTGDGVLDLVFSRAVGRFTDLFNFAFAGDARPEDRRLVRSTNALGEVTEIAWDYSSRFDNRRRSYETDQGPFLNDNFVTEGVLVTPELQALSTVFPVPVRLARHDGRGAVHVTDVGYEGGANGENGFEGFARSTQRLPSGLRKETLHWGEKGFNDKIIIEESYDAAGQLRLRNTLRWSLRVFPGTFGQVTQVSLEANLQESFDAGGDRFRVSGSQNRYDDRLNLIEAARRPDVFTTVGETRTLLTWIRDEVAGIWSLADSIRVEGGKGLVSETIFAYDDLPRGQVARGLPTERRDWIEGTTYLAQRIQYDEYGNIVAIVDRNGKLNTFEYGGAARLFRTRATDAAGRTVNSEYDPRFGALVRDVSAGGIERRSEYDAFGRLASIYLAGDAAGEPSIRYSYSDLGESLQFFQQDQLMERGQPDLLTTISYFDARGLVYQQDRNGPGFQLVRETREFDHAGAIVAESRPHFSLETPALRRIQRDEFGKPLRIEDGDGLATTLAYLADQVVVTDRRGEQTTITLDGDGNTTEISQVVEGVAEVTRYRYDESGRLVEVEDALGSITAITYDGFGRRTRLLEANLGEFLYRYDDEGNLLSLTAPDGGETTYAYNDVGELVAKNFPDGSTDTYEYGAPGGEANAVGKLVRVDDAAGSLAIRYDARGNVVEKRRTIGSAVSGTTYVTGYAFDNLDRLGRLTYPDGYEVEYHYDRTVGTLLSVTDSDGRTLVTDIERNAEDQIESARFGNGSRSESSYDLLGRPARISALASDGSLLQDLAYGYDDGHNVSSIDDLVAGQLHSFQYDATDRLSSATGGYGTELYGYDPTGGLLRKGDLAFAVDPLRPQRITCAMEAAVDPTAASCATHLANGTAGAFALAHDDRGNLIRKGDQRYEYDAENRVVRVSDGNGTRQRNVYDAAGQRVVEVRDNLETVTIDGIYQEYGETSVRHVLADSLLVGSIVKPRSGVNLIAELPTARPSLASGLSVSGITAILLLSGGCKRAWRRRWVRLAGGVLRHLRERPGQRGTAFALLPFYLVAMLQAALVGCGGGGAGNGTTGPGGQNQAQVFYYHADHLGNVQVVSDADGFESERRQYRPYGDRHAWTGSAATANDRTYSFGGHSYDEATGLYYMGARHYDPQLGRFLSADLIVANPGDPRALHRYAYAAGNPMSMTDPTGRFSIPYWDDLAGAVTSVWEAAESAANAVAGVATDIANWFEDNAETIAYVAIITAAVALAVASFGVASPILAGIMLGAAIGALESTLVHMANGGSIEDLMGPLLVSVALGAAFGALLPGASAAAAKVSAKVAARQAASRAAKTLGRKVAEKLAMPIARLAYVGASYAATGRSTTAGILRGGVAGAAFLDFVVPAVNERYTRPGDDVGLVGRSNGMVTYPMTE